MTEEHQGTEETLLDRVILPVGIPLAAIVVIEIFAFSLSRVLLASGRTPAVVVALAAALGILVGAAIVAARPRIRQSSLVGLFALLMVAVVAGGVWGAQKGPAPLPEHGEGAEDHGEGGTRDQTQDHATAVHITAKDIEFNSDTLQFPAGEAVTLHFNNQDPVQHNVSIYTSEEADEVLFKGEIFTGPEEVAYDLPALEEGEYFFVCDVHPTMTGTVVAE